MAQLKIPGVYVEETPTLPPRVSEVNSAIPAFIGYTQRTYFNKVTLLNQPRKIDSMLEFETIFGKGAPFKIENISLDLTTTENNAIVEDQYFLYNSIQLYFLNGGGPCYIVSVGFFPISAKAADFENGLNALDWLEEPTLYLFPDAVKLEEDDLAKIQQRSLRKCTDLHNRFSLLDLKRNTSKLDHLRSVHDFRARIGGENLKNGAAYSPWLQTTLPKTIQANSIAIIFELFSDLHPSVLDQQIEEKTVKATIKEYRELLGDLNSLKNNEEIALVFKDFEQEVINFPTSSYADALLNPFDQAEIFEPIIIFKPDSFYFQKFWEDHILFVVTCFKDNYKGTLTEKQEYLNSLLKEPKIFCFKDIYEFTSTGLQSTIDSYELFLTKNIPYYAALLTILENKTIAIPPSGAMAGIYCRTDQDRGVWKAPANISLTAVSGVDQIYSTSDLGELNVDEVGGKSINVIRPIVGHGIMVMGARTLAGNDFDWRYISVRRLFIFVQENLRKSTAWAIFEPNDRLLWLKITNQIENYLFELWRKGALAGTKPKESYYVHCGLNRTMTAQDLLEGKLIIEIGLAPIRPSEFIVLKITQLMQRPSF